jgi:hypothetical protein
VKPMAAGKLCYPVVVLVLMKTRDRPLHASGISLEP